MATAQPTVRGLSPTDLERIRDALATGRRPKVMFSQAAGQIAGQQGQVVQLTDPQLSDEWLVVRFGRDELPFSPTDLIIPPRGGSARRPGRVADGATAEAGPAGPPELSPVPAPREEQTVTASLSTVDSPAAPPARNAPVADKLNGRDPAGDNAAAAPSAEGAAAPSAEGDASSAKPGTRKPAKPKPPAALTVTLAYADGEWTVGAQQGSKALARPYVVRAAEALKMVALLDLPGVQAAVEEIVATARAQAESEAQRLRTELAEIEARLAELRDTR